MTDFTRHFSTVFPLPRYVLLIVASLSLALSGCVDPVSMVASSVLSAAIKTAIEQAEKNQPTPQELWQQAQLEQLQNQASTGNAQAQYKLGVYYIQVQEPAAKDWICAAANQGHAPAQLQFGHWYNEDRAREDLFPFIAITPDNTDAFIWYALAADNGEIRASHFRDSLIYGGIQTTKLDQARARLANWSPQVCDNMPTRPLKQAQLNQ